MVSYLFSIIIINMTCIFYFIYTNVVFLLITGFQICLMLNKLANYFKIIQSVIYEFYLRYNIMKQLNTT